jgi:WD40 repeat protein
VNDTFEYDCSSVLSGHTQDVKMIKWNSRYNMVFSCSYDDTIRAWKYEESVDDWICAYTMEGHTSTVWSIDFDKTDKYLVSVGDDMCIMIWEISETGYNRVSCIEGLHSR